MNVELTDRLAVFQPHIVILQIGGNDLCNPEVRPETLASQIIDFMTKLSTEYNVSQVLVCELFHRNKPSNITVMLYEHKEIHC